jgi:hypothetical protein
VFRKWSREKRGRKVGGGGVVGRKPSRRGGGDWKGAEKGTPSLTIIDFNLLIRLGLEARIKGRAEEEVPKKAVRVDVRRRRVRQRRARLLRGTLTDYSAWEESTDSDCEWEGGHRSAPSSPTPGLWNEKMPLYPRPHKAKGTSSELNSVNLLEEQ